MARPFKPIRFFAMMALLAFIVCGVTAYYTHRAEHGRTAEERDAFAMGETAGEHAALDSKLPSLADMNEMAERVLKKEPKKNEPMNWKTAYENGYAEGFRKTHSEH